MQEEAEAFEEVETPPEQVSLFDSIGFPAFMYVGRDSDFPEEFMAVEHMADAGWDAGERVATYVLSSWEVVKEDIPVPQYTCLHSIEINQYTVTHVYLDDDDSIIRCSEPHENWKWLQKKFPSLIPEVWVQIPKRGVTARFNGLTRDEAMESLGYDIRV